MTEIALSPSGVAFGNDRMEGLKEKEHMCPICFDTDPDGMLELDCHHHMHRDCIEGMVRAGWTGKRITFAFISCPECRSPISHPDLKKVLEPHRKLQQKVLQLSLHACLNDGIVDGLKELVKTDKDAALDAAANEISCFICSLCNEPMVGGRKDCADLERMNVSDVVCNSCEWKRPSAYKCTTHGLSEAMIKCDWCCNIATFTCGPGRFCNQCHQPPYAHTQSLFNRKKGGTRKKGQGEVCPGPDLCPLQIPHPPNGKGHTAFVIGCLHGCTNQDKTDIRQRAVIERSPSFLAAAAVSKIPQVYESVVSSGQNSKSQKAACCVVM